MSLTDLIQKRKNRPYNGADPAQAFGAEELTMEEIQRQNFVPPEKKAPSLARRAGAALTNLRTRIVGEEPEDDFGGYQEPQPPRAEAPVYSAENYQSENAPDLGWDNPFTEPSSAKKAAQARAAEQRRSYSQQPRYEPVYPETGYAPPYQEQGPWQPEPPQAAGYAPDYYQPPENNPPQADFYGNVPTYAPQPESWEAPPYPQEPYYREPYGYQEQYAEEQFDPRYGGAWYGTDNMPPRRSARPKSDPGDFKYMFWSGGIVLGMLLTLFSFIYGSVV